MGRPGADPVTDEPRSSRTLTGTCARQPGGRFDRQLADRDAINQLWQQLLAVRLKIAHNAGKPDYRAYRWQEMLRFDYTPADCRSFQNAIEQVVVPAALRIYERRRQRLGVSSLRPWDLDVDPAEPARRCAHSKTEPN